VRLLPSKRRLRKHPAKINQLKTPLLAKTSCWV
jgi:hypothetical protein